MEPNLKVYCSFVALLLLLGTTITPVSAAVVWSDDFEDGNFDGWITAWEETLVVIDGVLYKTSGVVHLTYLDHSSAIANGTWSLDFYHHAETQEVVFINCADGAYYLRIDNTIIRIGWNIDMMIGQMDSYEVDIDGWQHIDITRDLAGEINVFLNDTHILQGVHTEIGTCENFTIGLTNGGAIDNVTVSDTVDKVCTNETCEICHPSTTPTTTTTSTTTITSTTTTTTTTSTTTPPGIPMELLLAGIAVPVVIIVIVVVWKLKK